MKLDDAIFAPASRNPGEASSLLVRIYRKVLAVEIYSPYASKNLDLLDQGQRGIV